MSPHYQKVENLDISPLKRKNSRYNTPNTCCSLHTHACCVDPWNHLCGRDTNRWRDRRWKWEERLGKMKRQVDEMKWKTTSDYCSNHIISAQQINVHIPNMHMHPGPSIYPTCLKLLTLSAAIISRQTQGRRSGRDTTDLCQLSCTPFTNKAL